MYLNDPFDLTLQPQIEGWDKVEEEEQGPDYQEIFNAESHFRPGTLPYHNNFAVEICRFDNQGNHLTMAKNCPHYEGSDEEGPRIRPGWTVQQNV